MDGERFCSQMMFFTALEGPSKNDKMAEQNKISTMHEQEIA